MAYQICPNDDKWLIDSLTYATSKALGYLVLDHHLSKPENQTVVTNILSGEQLIYYINSHAKLNAINIFWYVIRNPNFTVDLTSLNWLKV